MFPHFTLSLPPWIESLIENPERAYESIEERMQLVIDLARMNVRQGTGGPFGAAVFDLADGKLVAPGVNLVLWLNCSVAHAEMTAIMLAQQVVGHYDLGADPERPMELVTSTEPCAMCLGAVPWSGVTRLVCGAREEDARSVGFEEGPKMKDWPRSLEERNITVVRDVLRREAISVLQQYATGGGMVYNSRAQNLYYEQPIP